MLWTNDSLITLYYNKFNPQKKQVDLLSCCKFYMYIYTHLVNKKIHATALNHYSSEDDCFMSFVFTMYNNSKTLN